MVKGASDGSRTTLVRRAPGLADYLQRGYSSTCIRLGLAGAQWRLRDTGIRPRRLFDRAPRVRGRRRKDFFELHERSSTGSRFSIRRTVSPRAMRTAPSCMPRSRERPERLSRRKCGAIHLDGSPDSTIVTAMGGRAATTAKLDNFSRSSTPARISRTRGWATNRARTPWVYLSSARRFWRTQEIVRQALTTLYADSPDGIPGNDDLGTMSAWYVWSAMGLYPQNPAVRRLAVYRQPALPARRRHGAQRSRRPPRHPCAERVGLDAVCSSASRERHGNA